MTVLDQIGQDKQRIAGRLARLDAERAKLSDQLAEFEVAERALGRFGGKKVASAGGVARRGHAESRQGARQGGQRRRSAQISLAEIRADGSAEPPRQRAVAPPPCRPARKPRRALVRLTIGVAGRPEQKPKWFNHEVRVCCRLAPDAAEGDWRPNRCLMIATTRLGADDL